MTRPSAAHPPRAAAGEVSAGGSFARACVAEWSRLWTVRPTWWLLAAAALIMNGIAVVAGISAAGQPDPPQGDPAWAVASIVILPAQFALLALALLAVTSDYATGGIVPTLQWTPRRTVLFLARALVAAGTATCLGALLAVTSSLAGYGAARPLLRLPLDEGVDTVSTIALVLAGGTLLAVGLGFLLRSTAAALVSVFLLLLVLPGLLPQLGYAWLTEVANVLPGTGALFLLTQEPTARGLTAVSSATTLGVWAACALVLGWLRLVRDDVNG